MERKATQGPAVQGQTKEPGAIPTGPIRTKTIDIGNARSVTVHATMMADRTRLCKPHP